MYWKPQKRVQARAAEQQTWALSPPGLNLAFAHLLPHAAGFLASSLDAEDRAGPGSSSGEQTRMTRTLSKTPWTGRRHLARSSWRGKCFCAFSRPSQVCPAPSCGCTSLFQVGKPSLLLRGLWGGLGRPRWGEPGGTLCTEGPTHLAAGGGGQALLLSSLDGGSVCAVRQSRAGPKDPSSPPPSHHL